jgi:hypothetical protein
MQLSMDYGPRTIDHLDGYLAAAGIELSVDVLDQIDQIVPPGVTVKVADNMWSVGTAALDAGARRRPPHCARDSFVRVEPSKQGDE